MKRICKFCKVEKNLIEFANAGIVNGTQYHRHLCIPCYTKSKAPRKQKIKNKYKEYKQTLNCSRCGFSDYRALQFHHLDKNNKKFNVSDAVSNGGCSWNVIFEEIKKCDILCANCHLIEHYGDVV